MHALSAWFTRNPVAANLLMALILIAGLFTLQSIRIEGFPTLPPDSIIISTFQSGASAGQVDRGITRKIEKALEGMPGVKSISAMSGEQYSTVSVQKISGFDMDRFHDEIKTRIDGITGFPVKAEQPVITRDEFTVEALLVQIYGADDPSTLQKLARQVKEELQSHPKITRIETFGFHSQEIRFEIEEEKLRYYNLTQQDIAYAIEKSSLDYKTGLLKGDTGKIIIRADHKALSLEEYAAIPVKTLSDGTRLLVGDLANPVDGFEDDEFFARFNGKPSAGIQIYTGKRGHLLQVSRAAHEIVERLRPQFPAGVELEVWADYSNYMKERLSLLSTNAWQGLLIVFCLLAVFLRVRLAFWVAVGIPVSIAGTLIIISDVFLGYSLNDLTTFGMIVVLGILVDDAIVVGESVFEARKKTENSIEGTIEGVSKVSTATTFGAFTTVAAFFPLLLIDSDTSKIFASFAIVVIVAVLVSLFESKLILPAHLAGVNIHKPCKNSPVAGSWEKIQNGAGKALQFANKKIYEPALRFVLRYRYESLILVVAIAICIASLPLNGWIKTVFFPDVPGQIITVNLHMKGGSPSNLINDNLKKIEQTLDRINLEVKQETGSDSFPVAHVLTALTDTQSGIVYAELQPEKDRAVGTIELMSRWREKVGVLEGSDELSFSATYETGGGFIVELGARDESVLKNASQKFSEALSKMDGVYDVRDDLSRDNPQIRLILKPEAQHLGLTVSDLASQIGDAFGGLEVQRIQRDAEEVRVCIRLRENQRRYMSDLINCRIRTHNAEWVPLLMIADVKSEYIPLSINRRNGKRVVQVRASIDRTVNSPSEIWDCLSNKIIPELTAAFPGITVNGAGELEEMGEMQGSMKRVLIIISILIYTLLAVPLKSYWKPVVIMSVIPFGFIGAMIGHWTNGINLSVLSFFGMLAVMGIVVNDSLVMISRFNDLRDEGVPCGDALIKTGTTRFKAIFLTTATTVCGLMPLLSETSEQARYLIPAAVSLAWGELIATPVTLFIIPVLLNIVADMRALIKRILPVFGKVLIRSTPKILRREQR
ncbi:MAG: efflux RND transporter permease subunit [Desulfobacteraceae bacterium]|jgi:multidrug efflux pump subunit AcrB